MFQRWATLSAFALVFAAPALAHTEHGSSFENTAIVRTVDLGGSLVHVTTTYAVKALEANSKVYTISMGPEERERASWMQAKIKGQQKTLPVVDHGFHDERYVNISSLGWSIDIFAQRKPSVDHRASKSARC